MANDSNIDSKPLPGLDDYLPDDLRALLPSSNTADVWFAIEDLLETLEAGNVPEPLMRTSIDTTPVVFTFISHERFPEPPSIESFGDATREAMNESLTVGDYHYPYFVKFAWPSGEESPTGSNRNIQIDILVDLLASDFCKATFDAICERLPRPVRGEWIYEMDPEVHPCLWRLQWLEANILDAEGNCTLWSNYPLVGVAHRSYGDGDERPSQALVYR
ncbi:hypothetical protein BJY04DRAFT_214768 [Aspergillus karnatakaensis]|uniref:uncharacterized protein n=1 Tax=Aspergillus karnatakaensis TaxID=1810916 RepID=UPI003CCE1ED4